jgi:uncharacterized membrane protein
LAGFALSLPERHRAAPGLGMLTKEVLFGLNALTLAGFALMGIGLTLHRQQKVRVAIAFALMGAGTALVFLGIYAAAPATP